jgi:hypothetical protein
MSDVVAVLTWLHVFSVVGWFGSFLYLLLVLFPLIGKMSPPARGEMMVKLLPSHALFTVIFGTMTVVFGGALYLMMRGGASPTWFTFIWIGIGFALVAYVLMLWGEYGLHRMQKWIEAHPAQMPPALRSPLLIVQFLVGFATLTLAFTFMVLAATLG